MLLFKKHWWLFLLPLVVPFLVFVPRAIQSGKTLYTGGGGFKTDLIGERSSLGTLSYYLEKEKIPNAISVRYFVTYLSGPHKGTSIYRLEYNRRDRTLTKSATVPPVKSLKDPPILTVWANVSEEAIHQVTAPVRAMKFIKEVENYQGGNLDELKEYGAVLKTQETAN